MPGDRWGINAGRPGDGSCHHGGKYRYNTRSAVFQHVRGVSMGAQQLACFATWIRICLASTSLACLPMLTMSWTFGMQGGGECSALMWSVEVCDGTHLWLIERRSSIEYTRHLPPGPRNWRDSFRSTPTRGLLPLALNASSCALRRDLEDPRPHILTRYSNCG